MPQRKNKNIGHTLPAEALGKEFQRKAKEMGVNPHQLSTHVGRAYDTVRKIYNGEEFPSDKTLVKMCQLLDLDIEDMRRILREEKALAKDCIPIEYTETDPILLKVGKNFKYLSDESKLEVLKLARNLADAEISTPNRKLAIAASAKRPV